MKLDIFRTIQNLKQLQDDIMSTQTKNYDDKYMLYSDLEQLIWITKSKLDHAKIYRALVDKGLLTHVEFELNDKHRC